MRKRITENFDGVECELAHEPVEGTFLKAQVGDRIVIAYLVYDDSYRDIDDMMGDGSGSLLSFHRHSKDIAKGLEALGNTREGDADLEAVYRYHEKEANSRYVNVAFASFSLEEHLRAFGPDGECEFDREDGENDVDFIKRGLMTDARYHDWECVIHDDIYREVLTQMWSEPDFFPGDQDAQLLAVYSHSGEYWSLSGQGMQCQWDTSNAAGVWIPDADLRTYLEKFKNPKERKAKARTYAQQFLNTFNEINSGQVFGCVVETFDEDGDSVDEDSRWGFIGRDYAEESLKSEFFDPTCKAVDEQYAEDVRTQCGQQLELV